VWILIELGNCTSYNDTDPTTVGANCKVLPATYTGIELTMTRLRPVQPSVTNGYMQKSETLVIGWIPNEDAPTEKYAQHFCFGQFVEDGRFIHGIFVGEGERNSGHFYATTDRSEYPAMANDDPKIVIFVL
jgi:hypothetical protein